MMSESPTSYKGTLFHEKEDVFFSKLDKFTGPLRHSAHEMVGCIEQLSWKNKRLNELKKAYAELESMAVIDLESGIEKIKNKFLKIDFMSGTNLGEAMNNADFVVYFDKQNHFNAEINALVKKAIELVD